MSGRVSAGRQFVVATIAAYWGYPPEPRSNSRTNSGLRKIRRKVSLDFAKFDWTRQQPRPYEVLGNVHRTVARVLQFVCDQTDHPA